MENTKRKKGPGEIEISMEDVEIIMGHDFHQLDRVLNSVFCIHCQNDYTGSIENYAIYLNNLEDLLFVGDCSKCKGPVARYLETGESPDKAEIARHIRAIKKEFKTIGTTRRKNGK